METLDLLTVAVPVIIGVIIVAIILSGYVKASPDVAYIISGFRKEPRILIGKAGIKIPFLEKKDELTLQIISIDVKTASAVPTKDYINVKVDAVVNIQVDSSPQGIKIASKNFLNKKPDYIMTLAREVLEGNTREIIGNMELRQMVSDRQTFANQVTENASPDLAKMGLTIASFNVQNFIDENGVIENLGIDNISQIKKDAQIARANAEKEVAIKQSEANRQANEAKVASELEIAKQNQQLEIEKARLKKETDIKLAEANAAYTIQEEEQRKTIEETKAEANILAQTKQIELAKKHAEVREQELDALIKKQAEADKFARELKAEADLFERQKLADAEQYEKQKETEIMKLEAEALRHAEEQKAIGIQALGLAEAESIKAKGEAEAEALNKKADAMKKYGDAAMMEMIVGVLPQMAGEIAKSFEKMGKITVIDSGSGEGVSAVSNMVPSMLAKTMESMKEVTGLDLLDVMKAETIQAKTNKNITIESNQPINIEIDPKEVI